MARYMILALLVLSVSYAVQAAAVPEAQVAETNQNTVSAIENAFHNAMESIGKGVDSVLKNPKVNEFYEDTKQFFKNAADNVRKETDKIIPKSD